MLCLDSAPPAKQYTYYGFVRDESLTRYQLITQQERACPDERRAVSIRAAGTGQQRSDSFFAACKSVHQLPAGQQPFMVLLAAIALPGSDDGRAHPTDLMYFPATRVTAAVRCGDDSFVGVMMAVDRPKEECAHFFDDSFGA